MLQHVIGAAVLPYAPLLEKTSSCGLQAPAVIPHAYLFEKMFFCNLI